MLAALGQTPSAQDLPGGGVPQAFAGKLAALAEDYELVLLDCAPGNPMLQDMALNAMRARSDGNVIELPAALSASADSLAGDYEQLARESDSPRPAS